MTDLPPKRRWGLHAFYWCAIVAVGFGAWTLASGDTSTASTDVASQESAPAVASPTATPVPQPTIAPRPTSTPTPTPTPVPTPQPTATPTPEPLPERGPTGLNWPNHTPSYATEATTVISDLSELDEALATASSGDVIEVLPHAYAGDRELIIESGNAGWAQNVLVRPPLGQRQSVVLDSSVTLNAPHVTIAGFRANATITLFDKADRSSWARIELGQDGFVRVRNAQPGEFLDDAGVYEIAALVPRLTADRMQLSSIEGGGVRRFTISGVWLKGSYRPAGTAQHNDTLQIFTGNGGVGPEDLTIENSVFFASHSATLALPFLQNTFTFRNSLAMNCGYMTDVPENHECDGTLNLDIGVSPGVQILIEDSDLFGGINLRQNDFTTTLENVRTTGVKGDGAAGVVDAGDNRIDASVASGYVEPLAPDLDVVWHD